LWLVVLWVGEGTMDAVLKAAWKMVVVMKEA
jgi:hypothetical protein